MGIVIMCFSHFDNARSLTIAITPNRFPTAINRISRLDKTIKQKTTLLCSHFTKLYSRISDCYLWTYSIQTQKVSWFQKYETLHNPINDLVCPRKSKFGNYFKCLNIYTHLHKYVTFSAIYTNIYISHEKGQECYYFSCRLHLMDASWLTHPQSQQIHL